MNKKKIWIGTVVLVVVLVGAVLIFGSGEKKNSNEPTTGTNEQTTSTAPSSVSGSKTAAPIVTKMSYEQALLTYADKRFQFDSLCQASPAQRVLKNGAEIMLDNRANVARSIYVDGARYSLTAYGFRIVKLYSNNLPHTTIIDCGAGKNSAKVILN